MHHEGEVWKGREQSVGSETAKPANLLRPRRRTLLRLRLLRLSPPVEVRYLERMISALSKLHQLSFFPFYNNSTNNPDIYKENYPKST